jgi:proteasome lid subunit RPN8/RPN11
MTMLAVSARVVRLIDDALPRAGAREICGLLLGSNASTDRAAIHLLLSAEFTWRVGEFALSQSDICRISTWADARGLTVLAVLHSHPSGDCSLSAADSRALRYSSWPWVIATRECGAVILTGYSPPDAQHLPVEIRAFG